MKTIKVVHKPVARDLSISPILVEKINDFYWKEFKNELVGLKHTTFYVKEIGTFTVSKYKLYKKIQQLISKLRFLDRSKYTEAKKEQIRQDLLITLRKCLVHRNALAIEQYGNIKRDKSISTTSD